MTCALYPNRRTLPSIALLAGLLAACEGPHAPTRVAEEPWPNSHEALFQEAESLKYSLSQHELEEQRLREIGAPTLPPAPRR